MLVIGICNININFVCIFLKPHKSEYASCLFFELFERKGSYFVQVIYRKTPTDNTLPLNIPKCGTMCPLDKFYELYQDILPGETEVYETLCNNAFETITINATLCVFTLFFNIFYFCKNN